MAGVALPAGPVGAHPSAGLAEVGLEAELVEFAAVADLFAAAPAHLAARHGIASWTTEAATCTSVGDLPEHSVLNRVLGAALGARLDDARIEEICAWFAERETSAHVGVAPAAWQAGLAGALGRHGFVPGYAWTKFARRVDPHPAPRLERVRPARPAEAEAFGQAVAEGFGLPPFLAAWLSRLVGRPGWSCHLALDGGQIAGAGALYRQGRTAWLGLGCVLPAHRGRGLQRELFASRLAAAAAAGCDLAVTETGVREPGRPGFSYANILRAGFSEAYVRPNYVRRFVR
jgi:GNAT superfamily N-acetyltransferase